LYNVTMLFKFLTYNNVRNIVQTHERTEEISQLCRHKKLPGDNWEDPSHWSASPSLIALGQASAHLLSISNERCRFVRVLDVQREIDLSKAEVPIHAPKQPYEKFLTTLGDIPMYGVASLELNLYGCHVFDKLSGTCVPVYLADHMKTLVEHVNELICTQAYLSYVRERFTDANHPDLVASLQQATDANTKWSSGDGLRHNRVFTPEVKKAHEMIIKMAGVRAKDIVPVCEHYHRSLFCLDVTGNCFFAYEDGDMRDKYERLVKTNPKGGRVVGVLYGNHWYA